MTRLVGAFDSWSAWWSWVTIALKRQEQRASWADQYNTLKAYYLNNGLYEVLDALLASLGAPTVELRPLRNPAFRVVEFYAAKLWPGALPEALPVVAENEALAPAIVQLWRWSNWGSEKQAAARWFACYGDMFLKVATRSDGSGRPVRVFLQNLEPQYVTDFDADERGFLIYVRIDIPRWRREDDQVKAYTHTEVWTKAKYWRWEHTKPVTTPVAQLGTPAEVTPLAQFGIDFVPVVWQPFRNIGDERGCGAFTLTLDKIDEVNRQATRLHQMLFRYNRPLWTAAANAMDPQGRPLPPPRLGTAEQDGQLEMSDDTVLRLPGLTTLQSLVPPLNYEAALRVLEAQMAEVQRDLPELAYYELRQQEVSGRAANILLGDAVDRLLEARGNAETALIRAQQMALTIGQNLGLFAGLGTYEAGDFEHSFALRPVLTPSEQERAELVGTWVQAGLPLLSALRRSGENAEELIRVEEELQADQVNRRQFADAVLSAAQRDFDQGQV